VGCGVGGGGGGGGGGVLADYSSESCEGAQSLHLPMSD